jgi:hypothetical protein
LAAGVGARGGQPGSIAKARGSLAAYQPMNLESPLGTMREATQAGGESQPEERHGLTAEVLRIDRRRKNPVRRVFESIFPPYPTLKLKWFTAIPV